MFSPFLSLRPTSSLLPQPLFPGAAAPTAAWKNPRCWSGASVPCVLDVLDRGVGGGGSWVGGQGHRTQHREGGRLRSSPPHPHLPPGGPRDEGGWGACPEDRTSSWQDTGRRPEVPSLSRTQGEKVTGAWGPPRLRPAGASDSSSQPLQTGTEDSRASTSETPQAPTPSPRPRPSLAQARDPRPVVRLWSGARTRPGGPSPGGPSPGRPWRARERHSRAVRATSTSRPAAGSQALRWILGPLP